MKLSSVIKSYLLSHIWTVVLAVLIIAGDITLTLISPIMLKYIVDTVIVSEDYSLLWAWAIFYALSYIGYGIFEFLKSVILIKISQGICTSIRIGLLEKVNLMSYESLSSYDIGSIESLFNNDVNTINKLVSDGVISMIVDLFKMVGILISIFVFSINIGWLVLALVPLISAFVLFVRRRMFVSKLKSKQMEQNVNQRVLENIENIESIQSCVAYDYVSKRYDEILRTHFDAQQTSMFYDSIFSPIMQLVRYSLIATVIMISTVNPTIFGITIGTFLSLSDLLSSLFTPMENIGMELQTLQDSSASIHRINDFIGKDDQIKPDKEPALDLSKLSIEYKNVFYSYTKDEPVIVDFSYKLKQGERLTLEGNSGVGKSTLFKLGYGLIVPNKGEVKINNVKVFDLTPSQRKTLLGIVYQDSFFSNGTIREELTFGDNYQSDEIFSVLKSIGLDRIKNIDVQFKESDYSSGELALFNIARVLLKNPKIIFLDEMNAKIDPETAMKIIRILDSLPQDTTILSISHYGTKLKNSTSLILTNR